MKIVKKIIFFIATLIIIALITALFVKKEYSVEQQIVINKPKQEIFNYIKLLKNQDNYSKWASMDTNMKKTYTGTDGTVGFISAWESEKEEVGSGEQEIKNIVNGERVDYELRFIKPFESTSPAYITTETIANNKTKVKWGFKGKMDYPSNLMMLFMDFEKMIGNDLQTGLNNLKTELEK